jgi:hypothetical protein
MDHTTAGCVRTQLTGTNAVATLAVTSSAAPTMAAAATTAAGAHRRALSVDVLATVHLSGSSGLCVVPAFSVAALTRGGEEDPEPVVLEVSEAVSEAADPLDDQVDDFGGWTP